MTNNNFIQFIKEKSKVLSGVLVIGSFMLFIFLNENRRSKVKKELLITHAIITSIEPVYGMYGGYASVHYSFVVSNRKYSATNSCNKAVYANKNKIVGMSFLVACQKTNPQNCEILLSPSDFRKYNQTYPDSLEWLRAKCFPTESTYR